MHMLMETGKQSANVSTNYTHVYTILLFRSIINTLVLRQSYLVCYGKDPKSPTREVQ